MKGRPAKPRKMGAKGAETRRLLLEAARKLFYGKGIGATTLDEVAAEAGVTKGAIYDHFASKNDLVFELFSARKAPLRAILKGERPAREHLQALHDFLTKTIPRRPTYITSNYEFNHYIASNPELGVRFANIAHDQLSSTAERIEEVIPADEQLLSPVELTIALSALHSGLLFHRLVAPDLVSDEVIDRIFNLVLGLSENGKDHEKRKKRRRAE